MKFREKILPSGIKLILGKDENSNDELMKLFKGKKNTILHTSSPGSPFGVIDGLNPLKEDIGDGAAFVAKHSQDWRDNKKDVFVDVFTGKDISKWPWMKPGSWKVKGPKRIKVKKLDILKLDKGKK